MTEKTLRYSKSVSSAGIVWGESFLKEEIRRHGKRGLCSYCRKTRTQYSIELMAERVERAFEQHYTRTARDPDAIEWMMMRDRESDYEWEREGEPVVWATANSAHVSETAAEDIQKVLAHQFADDDEIESEFESETYYEEKGVDDAKWQREWRQIEQTLQTEARFFSRSAAQHLTSVFHEIELMQAGDGRSLITDAGPNTELPAPYRARAFQADASLEEALARPDRHLGSPPSAAAAGRMNARGISVFYGANDPLVALSEVRPPVGSRVAVARFNIIRPIRLLDLAALSSVVVKGSIFDPTWLARLERAAF